MVLAETVVLVAPVMAIPATVDDAPVLDSVLMLLPVITMDVEVFEHVIPVTFPPVPVEDKLLIVLFEIVTSVAVLTVDPIVIPVIFPWLLILVTVFVERLEVPVQYVIFIAFTVPVPLVTLLIVFPVTVLVGAVPPSVKLIPFNVDVPARVILEKLLLRQFEIAPVTEEPLSRMSETVPLAPGRL
jgi:hypothetical protein